MQSITLQTNDSVISSGDALGQVQFAASAESDGGASRLIGAKIYAQGEGAFNASSNPTSIIFATSAADNLPASGKIKIDDNGNIIPLLTQNYNLGSSSSEFANLYISDSLYVSGIALIDGSNYTIGSDTYSLASGVIVDGGDSSSANVDLLFRRGLNSEWESNNPVLASGEPGWDVTNNLLKIGNGIDSWNELNGITGDGSTTNVIRGTFLLNEPSGSFTIDQGYNVGSLDIFMNGVKLSASGDYIATDGSSFTLTENAPSGSIIEYLALTPSNVNTGGGINLTSSGTAPSNPSVGDMWFNTDTANLFIYIDDGNSSNWLEPFGPAGPAGSGIFASVEEFNAGVSGLLPVKDIVGGSGISVEISSGIYTIAATGTSVSSTTSFSRGWFLS